ncbi:hypothetical protein EJ05DRAFT_479861 [Pseudovirgaria hyperparasitica]|uniref:Protein kinase domain-containing protein n=1 Tax=Pseudovirgaria hyperparasitica TaxID=470096 RepID=A0A6A6VXB6_9PEZI|nr:uncharacterized protein EJ05DRAFT_479861 [Pseudovirgaria hyperparasitica]KAF2754344.1 hypothetical protein EJ05DRAFT_479861 [Pseudovirgaria hyperparasitica]
MAQRPLYEIGNTESSIHNTDVELNVFVSDTHFCINLLTANFEGSPGLLKEYLLHVEHSDPEYIPPLPENPDGNEFVDPLEEFYEWATKPFLSLFREIPPLDRQRLYTLQDCLFPKQVSYTLQLAGDELVPVQVPNDAAVEYARVGVLLPPARRLDSSTFPVYRPRDIHIRLSDNAMALPQAGRVYLQGQDVCFFKKLLPGDISMTSRELSTYAKIHAAELKEDVHTSRLLGLVEDEVTSRIAGFLLSYIDCANKTLLCAGWDPNQALLREKWVQQITHSIHELHAHQIVWGDAKPDNVLIDELDNAYLVDFGGGYTNGWVDKELVNTVEGDLQGLERIAKYLSEAPV